MAKGKYPVTFRTRKSSPSAPMVLHWRRCGRVGRRRTIFRREAVPSGAASLHFTSGTLREQEGRRWQNSVEAGPRAAAASLAAPEVTVPARPRELAAAVPDEGRGRGAPSSPRERR